ncbi:MAG: copper resistance protein NlpE N-terminal domain-containing protein [Vicingaceae bacterium]
MPKTIFLIAIGLLLSCGTKKGAVNTLEEMKESETVLDKDQAHNSQNSLDWKGTYRGILPCADCIGIQTKLTLNDDSSYQVQSFYLGKSNEINSKKGRYQFTDYGSTIVCRINNKIVSRYKVEENQLRPIGSHGEDQSEIADRHILRKNQSEIVDRYWVATEIMGESIKEIENGRQPFVQFTSDNQFSASGGCNSMFGTFKIEKKRFIQFGEIAMSERACQKKHYDMELASALQKSRQFILTEEGTKLQLIVGKAAPLAKFRLKGF